MRHSAGSAKFRWQAPDDSGWLGDVIQHVSIAIFPALTIPDVPERPQYFPQTTAFAEESFAKKDMHACCCFSRWEKETSVRHSTSELAVARSRQAEIWKKSFVVVRVESYNVRYYAWCDRQGVMGGKSCVLGLAAMPVNSTHLDYDANAAARLRARVVQDPLSRLPTPDGVSRTHG